MAGARDTGLAIAVDSDEHAYVTGLTASTNYPTTFGTHDTTHNGGFDVFVTKLSDDGSTLVYSTYVGGLLADLGTGIAVDPAGFAYVNGETDSANFPTTFLAFDTIANGGTDSFVTKLHPLGTSLFYSTYLGGAGFDGGTFIAADAGGFAYVTGVTASSGFPTTTGAYDTTHNGGNDAFVTKLGPLGIAPLTYSTFLGGSVADVGAGIALDSTLNAYVTGFTDSSGFPTSSGAYDTTHNGGTDAFVTGLNPTGTGLVYSTFIGGGSTDEGLAIAVDSGGRAVITGRTTSSGYPTTVGAFDVVANGTDAFVTKLNATGTALVYSTFLGGSDGDHGNGIAVDSAGRAYVTGVTSSANFPTVSAYDTTHNGGNDAFVTKLDLIGRAATLVLTPPTGINEVGMDHTVTATVKDISLQPVEGVTVRFNVTGANSASGFNVTNATGQTNFNYSGTVAGTDTITAFADTNNDTDEDTGEPSGTATKIWLPGSPEFLILTPPAATNEVGTSHTVTATVTDIFGNPVPFVNVTFNVTGAHTTGGTEATDEDGKASFTYPGTVAGTDAITAFADTSGDGDQDVGEPTDAATKIWTPGAPETLILTPPTATNPVGTSHTVTATVKDAFGNPVPNATIQFNVTGVHMTGGTNVTDTDGNATFTYSGTVAGADAITGFVDDDGDQILDPGETTGPPATKTWTAGAPDTLVLTPPTETNEVGTDHTVTATVRDVFLNPVSGVTVYFEVTGANTEGGSDVTDADGNATFTYSGTVSGTDTITAFADTDNDTDEDTGEPSGTATKIWLPGSPEFLILTPPAATNEVGTSHTVTATVTDIFGNPVPFVNVTFNVTGAHTTGGTEATDEDGKASFTYPGTVAGTDAITAFADTSGDGDQNAGEPTDAATKIWTPGAPDTLVLTPPTATNPVGTSHTVTATVRDVFLNPVPGVTVLFEVTGANLDSGSNVTDVDGNASFTYSGTVAGADTITAFADTNNNGDQDIGEPSDTATKIWTPGAPDTLVLTPPADTNTVGTQHSVTATVRDAFSNPVPGVTVRFSVTGANSASGSNVTNATGQANFTYTGTVAGTDTISAFADTDGDGTKDTTEPSGTATKIWLAGAPNVLVLTPPTDTNTVGNPHTVTATVRDAFLNPVPGVTVRFSVTGVNTASGSSTTNATGQATFSYTGTVAGTDTISAFADTDGDGTKDTTEPSGTATKIWLAGAPATLVLTPETDSNTVGTSHTVTATVKDALGNPVPGVIVRFNVIGANSAGGFNVTNAQGDATFTYTGTETGTDTITAFADTNTDGDQDTGEPGDTATKVWTAGAPATLDLTPKTSTNTVGTDHTVTATVEDSFGNPVPNVVVRFSVTGAHTTSGSSTTNAQGNATFTYSGTKSGTDTITAFADTDGDTIQDAGEPSDTANKVWKPGAPATLVLTPETATNPVGTTHTVTATVKDAFGNPVPGVTVRFNVTGAHTTGGSSTTNAEGNATFSYTGTDDGTDTITAFADTNNDGDKDSGEPSDTATKVWTEPTEGCPSGGGDDDEDDDGLEDNDETFFNTLLGNVDTDLDGILDGNDDSDDDGKDDEDEDDGTADECPNDSDGDGEDDEDEDDEEGDD